MESLSDVIWGEKKFDEEGEKGDDPQHSPMPRPCMIAMCDGGVILQTGCTCGFPMAISIGCD